MKFYLLIYSSALLLFAVGSGCSTSHEPNKRISTAYLPDPSLYELIVYDTLIGSWYGKTELEDGGIYEWITRRYEDGEYHLEGRITYQDSVVNNIDYGNWGFDGDIEFRTHCGWIENGEKIAKEPNYPQDWHTYKTLDINDESHQYLHEGTGNIFTANKVSDDFHFD